MDLAFLTRLIGLALVALPVAYAYPSSLSSSISAPLSQTTVTIAGQVFIVDPADIILDRTTVQPGSAGISINGQIVSADAAHDLFVDGTEMLANPTGSNSAENIANNKTAKFSSNATFSGSVPASSVTAAVAGYNILGGELAHIAVQVASTHATYRAGVPISTSVSASTSMAATPSGGSAPLGPVVIPSASSAMTNSSISKASTAGLAPNVQENASQTQSRSTGSDSMSASTPKINLIPTGSSIHSNSSSGLYVVAGASKISSSVSSDRQSMHSTGTPSPSAILVPGGQPNTITTGPTLAIPTISLNPTGSVASSQVMLLVGAIFSITEEAKTLSAIIKDNGPKVSLVSKIKGIDDRILNELEDMHPPGPPPSYEEACLHGASIFDLLEDLGCLKGAFDKVIGDLEDDTTDITKTQTVFDNIGKLAENLEKEEEDDDDDETSTSETDSQASKTRDSETEGSSTSMSSTPSTTSTASSRMSSSSSTATATIQLIDRYPLADPDTSNYSAPDVANQAFMAFLGAILSSANGIGSGPSGFAVVIGSAKATANSSSSSSSSSSSLAVMSSLPATVRTSSSARVVPSEAAATGIGNLGSIVAQVASEEAASSQAGLTTAAASPGLSSGIAAGFAALGGEIAHIAAQLATTHTTQPAGVAVTTGIPIPTSTAVNDNALGAELAAIAYQIASASVAAIDAAKIASPSPVTSSSLAPSPAPSPQPTGTKWSIDLAFQIYTWGGANAMTDFYYKVWMTNHTRNAAGPDFCAANSWIANVQIDDAVTNAPPYPKKDFKFAIPAGILEPAPLPCTWQPSPGNSQPGSMTCNPGEEIVLCTIPVTTAITCKQDNPDRIEPLAQYVFWQ